MSRAIAFLHAINVDGRLAANAKLCEVFESLGYTKVRTFISTGNVVFDARVRPTPTQVLAMEKALLTELGFAVPVFTRSEVELRSIAQHPAFDHETLVNAKEMHVGFVSTPLPSAAVQRLMALRTPLDQFHVNQREIYWLCRSRRNASAFSSEVFAKALHVPVTFRPLSTLLRMIPWIEAERPSASRLGKK